VKKQYFYLRAQSGSCPKCGREFVAEKNKGLRGLKTHIQYCGLTNEDRFWPKVDKNGPGGCWIWTGPCNSDGHGTMDDGKRTIYAHRFSYALVHGQITPAQLVLHACNVPACVNPAHLRIGTDADNVWDKQLADRSGIKLNIAKAREIKSLLAANVLQSEIADSYGVTPAIVSAIKRGLIWKHVPWPK
jgi:hypothetical protein